jgi:hypothetical protein
VAELKLEKKGRRRRGARLVQGYLSESEEASSLLGLRKRRAFFRPREACTPSTRGTDYYIGTARQDLVYRVRTVPRCDRLVSASEDHGNSRNGYEDKEA